MTYLDAPPNTERPETAKAAWSLTEVALELGISIRALHKLRTDDPTFPAPKMVLSLQRWAPAQIHAWMAGPPAKKSRRGGGPIQ